MVSLFQYLPFTALFFAGVVHLIIAPEHFAHAPAHGLFFGIVGAAQLLWSVGSGVSLWNERTTGRRWLAVGIVLSGGVLVVWLFTHLVATPFTTDAHPLDLAAIVTKCAEVAALSVLLSGIALTPIELRDTTQTIHRPPSVLWGLGLGMVSGIVIWGSGMGITLLMPSLADGVGHHHSDHNHNVPSALVHSTAAYFSIVNAGHEADMLVSISGDSIGRITLHQTIVNAQDVAQMSELESITLNPNVRFDFSPAGNHVMLEDLPRDLYDGDNLTLTLHFASGRAVPVEFTTRLLTPEARLNFVAVDDFQITNAWVRATASLDGLVAVNEGSYEWHLPQGFPLPRIPNNNPMTAEKVELGRYLFYDARLSGNGTQSCSSCHLQALAFTDGQALPIGSTGDIHPRNSITLTNTAYSATLTWANPNLTVLERQIPIPMFGEHPVEMGITGNEDLVLTRFRQDTLYQTMFAAAFPDQSDPFTFNNVALALASFNRTLISGNSPYDQYVRGDTTALSESAQRGMALFFSEGLECHHCHTGFNFTLSTVTANSTFEDYPFFNTGLYNIGGTGAYPTGNTGIHEITNVASDMGRFRPPTLRNIALTAPYMHDGSIATLPEVIQFYIDGGRVISEGDYVGDGRANPYKNGLVPGFTLTNQEIADVIAYLESLTDAEFITDPRFSDPFSDTNE